jgi:hypothetical protein
VGEEVKAPEVPQDAFRWRSHRWRAMIHPSHQRAGGVGTMLQAFSFVTSGECLIVGFWSLFGPQKVKPHWSIPAAMLVMGGYSSCTVWSV